MELPHEAQAIVDTLHEELLREVDRVHCRGARDTDEYTVQNGYCMMVASIISVVKCCTKHTRADGEDAWGINDYVHEKIGLERFRASRSRNRDEIGTP